MRKDALVRVLDLDNFELIIAKLTAPQLEGPCRCDFLAPQYFRRPFSLGFSNTTTIAGVKQFLGRTLIRPPQSIRLLSSGRALRDSFVVSGLRFGSGAVISIYVEKKTDELIRTAQACVMGPRS